MFNLNDSIYDTTYSTSYDERDVPEYKISDKNSLIKLIPYEVIENNIIDSIQFKKKSIYLRFCDGEFLYYHKGYSLLQGLKKLFGKGNTCRGEKPNSAYIHEHFMIFEKHKEYIHFFPHISDSYIGMYKKSMLYDYITKNNIQIGHFYYIYHFLNKLKQKKITELSDLKIAYITHHNYISGLPHYKITPSFSLESREYLYHQDFSKYDLLLLGGGTASPLYADAIANSAKCPIIDAGYMLSIRESNEKGERPFTGIL